MTSDERPSRPLPELRASDADRDRVANVLREALAEGRLSMDEFEERLESAYQAKTYGELEPLTADLPGPESGALSLRKRQTPAGSAWPGRIGGRPTSTAGIGVLGGFQRRGRWTVPRLFTAVTVCGGGEIDLRDADFESADTEIRVVAVMGGVNIVVPPEIEVEVRGLGIMGGFDQSHTGTRGAPGAPRVVVTGFAFWGGVGISRRRRHREIAED
ncbi:hypothetical protein SRB5_41110 [Streptomyces sp. RB5]|uniref:DUF1707 domain-containing protein n=1 Tax=Streptomyces smaragdinus TaxID=2585196 RepID=A0A7K0CKL1_9ACTN|nr:DUF1707 domain-containing protein [Streptomyces smaragdinus]MQY13951.1 hypothetical protein [Streptomyces smaragdinus]